MKKGDIFTMQWGYEQTNNTFFRVKALRGKTQAVIEEVALGVKSCDPEGYSPMAADYTYDENKSYVKERSVFIKDNAKGRIVKIQNEHYGDPEHSRQGFYIDYHFCSPYHGEKLYESWYA